MVRSVIAALEMVEDELPVVPDLSLARDAQILLEACQAADVVDWSMALALGLENTLVLAGRPQAQPPETLSFWLAAYPPLIL